MAAELMVPMRPVSIDRDDARRDPLDHRLDVAAPALPFFVLPLQVHTGPLQAAAARRHLGGHGVERIHHRAEFVSRLELNPVVVVSGANLARGDATAPGPGA